MDLPVKDFSRRCFSSNQLAGLKWPEPSRASRPAGVSVKGAKKFCIHAVGKDVLVPQPRDVFVQPLDTRHTAAKNYYVGIQDVDHMRQLSSYRLRQASAA